MNNNLKARAARMIVACALVLLVTGATKAEAVRIVAIGASNTAGYGVGSSRAWPARLEAMLRARCAVARAGRSGAAAASDRCDRQEIAGFALSAVETGACSAPFGIDGSLINA